MKKLFVLLLAAAVLMTAAGCAVNHGGTIPEPEDQAQSASYTAAPTDNTAAPADNTPAPEGERVDFTATDINGEPISMADFAQAKVIMINFFETWCPPCMGELPDLEALYEKYGDKGFVILGVYSSSDESAMKSVIEGQGITYPVFGVTSELTKYQTQYVPTSIFVDGNGRLLSEEPYVGSKSYSDWENVINSYLHR